MLKYLFYSGALGLALLCGSCTKEPVIVGDNQAPPDSTISTITIEKYVNKVYISELGREADAVEFPAAVQQLRAADFTIDARKTFVAEVQAKPEFNTKLFDVARQELLNNISMQELQERKDVYLFILTNQSLSYLWPQVNMELPRLDSLLVVPAVLANGTIDVLEMHKRCVNNFQYDEINMGSLNFCVSMLQNFLFRYPTEA